jgi:hypothetical protein
MVFFTQKVVIKLLGYGLGISYPKSGIQKKYFHDPRSGSRDQKALDPGSGSATLFERKISFSSEEISDSQ